MSVRIFTIIFCSGTFLAIACAAPMGSPDGKDGLKTPEDYCAARAEAECTTMVVQKCGAKDQSSCEKASGMSCIAEIPQGTTYVPEAAAVCIAKTRDAYSDGTLTSAELADIHSTCAKVFSGSGAVRAPCTVDADCSSRDGLSCIL